MTDPEQNAAPVLAPKPGRFILALVVGAIGIMVFAALMYGLSMSLGIGFFFVVAVIILYAAVLGFPSMLVGVWLAYRAAKRGRGRYTDAVTAGLLANLANLLLVPVFFLLMGGGATFPETEGLSAAPFMEAVQVTFAIFALGLFFAPIFALYFRWVAGWVGAFPRRNQSQH